jgi:hypothetical protein
MVIDTRASDNCSRGSSITMAAPDPHDTWPQFIAGVQVNTSTMGTWAACKCYHELVLLMRVDCILGWFSPNRCTRQEHTHW